MKSRCLVWSGAILANLSMLATSVLAYLPPINFEAPEFQPFDPVDSGSGGVYADWELISGAADVSPDGEGFGGGQALRVGQTGTLGETRLRRLLDWDPVETVAFIDLRIKPPANPAGSLASLFVNGSQVAFQLDDVGTTGEFWVYHGNDDAPDPATPEEWYRLAPGFSIDSVEPRAADYVRLTLRHDSARLVWDLFVDGQLAAANVGFDGRAALLGSLEFYGSDVTDVLIDDLAANPDNMLFPDADKDALPDAWETANGSNPLVYDRDEINPATGKSWLEDYLDSIWSPSGAEGVVPSVTPPPVGAVPPLTILGQHTSVGALKGSLTVGGDGSAAYSIPIDIPKGTAGMEPKISLDYSSNGANGIAGLGWSLNGLQQIARGRTTLAKDGMIDGVDFDPNDRFFFNGERLVLIEGIYGEADSVYRTEMDSFARITARGQLHHGPEWWQIETKSGLTLTSTSGMLMPRRSIRDIMGLEGTSSLTRI